MEGLANLVPRVEEAHSRVAALGLPDLATHGDAHPMNALSGPAGSLWFDWSEAGVAHPFLDAGWFFAWFGHPAKANLPVRREHPDAVGQLWAQYLDALEAREAERALPDAVLLALVHRAVAFDQRFRDWQGTVPGWRPQYVPYYLRLALRAGEQFAR